MTYKTPKGYTFGSFILPLFDFFSDDNPAILPVADHWFPNTALILSIIKC